LRRTALCQRVENDSKQLPGLPFVPSPRSNGPLLLHSITSAPLPRPPKFPSLLSIPRVGEAWTFSYGQLDKLLLPLQARGGEGGQGAAHGCGRRAARRGEDAGGLQRAPACEEAKVQRRQVQSAEGWFIRLHAPGRPHRGIYSLGGAGRGGAPLANRRTGLSFARAKAGSRAQRGGERLAPQGLLLGTWGCPRPGRTRPRV
jgi:hypothetical protein